MYFNSCRYGGADMDLSGYTISAQSVSNIAITLFSAIIIPLGAMVVWKILSKAKISSFLFGAGTFLAFAFILESMLHRFVISALGEEFINTHVIFYVIYGALAAGIFEEVGRFLVMRFVMKPDLPKKESIMFGIGHGGIECILIVAFSYIGNLAIATMLNSGNANSLLEGLDEAQQTALVTSVKTLAESPSYIFLVPIFERIVAIAFHVCLSYLVFRAVRDSKTVLVVYAVILHAAMDGSMSAISILTKSTLITEIYLLVFTAVVAFFTVKAYLKDLDVKKEPTI